MSYGEDVVVSIAADTSEFRKSLGEMEGMSNRFGSAIAGALKSAVAGGKDFSAVLSDLAMRLADMALDAALKPVGSALSSSLSGLFSGFSMFADGGVFSAGRVVPFADGGVVAAPTFFPMSGNRMGLMGEAGAEAVLPLARGADGSLGVRANGAAAAPVTVNIAARDVESFRRSEAQVSAMLARAVKRGRRAM
ncbi:MAG: phage tail tape measure protein [Hyphomicrobiales bacterium]